MTTFTGAFDREERRAYYYKKLYQQHVKLLFNFPVHPKSDNIVYDWKITHHDVYSVNKDHQKNGILVSFHPLKGPFKVEAYQDGELLCNIDTVALMQLLV
jgi:hypothetical protein